LGDAPCEKGVGGFGWIGGKNQERKRSRMMVKFSDVLSVFGRHLGVIGFQRKGGVWSKRKGEILLCVEVGCSSYSKKIFVSLGVYMEMLDEAKHQESKLPLKGSASCHLTSSVELMIRRESREDHREFVRLADFEEVSLEELKWNVDGMFMLMRTHKIFEQLDEVSTYEGVASFIQEKKMSMGTFLVKYYRFSEVLEFCHLKAVAIK
jgi:hypothetical protein